MSGDSVRGVRAAAGAALAGDGHIELPTKARNEALEDERVTVVLRLRLWLAAMFAVLTVFLDTAAGANVSPVLYASLAAWVGLAVVLRLVLPRVPRRSLRQWYLAHALAEVVVITAIYYATGGISWFGFIGYVVVVVLDSVLLSRAAISAVVALAALLSIAVAGAVASGLLPHHELFPLSGPDRQDDVRYVVASLIAITLGGTVSIVPILRLTTRELRRRQDALERANRDLTAAEKEALESRRALAAANASLEGHIASKTQELSLLAEIGRLVNSSLDLEDIQTKFATALHRVLPFHVLTVAFPIEGRSFIRYLRFDADDVGELRTEVSQVQGDGMIMQWTAETQRRSLFSDVEEQFFFRERSFLVREGLKSLACVPLVAQGRAIGSLNIARREAGAYTTEHLDLLERLVEPLSLAAENARLYREANLRTSRTLALGKIARAVTSKRDVSAVCAEAVAQLRTVVRFDEACIIVARSGEPMSAFVARQDAVGEGANSVSPYGEEDLRTETAARLVRDTELERLTKLDAALRRAGFRSSVRVPIEVNHHWTGLLMLNAAPRAAFGDEELGLLEEVAQLVGLAVESASLYEELRRNAETDSLTGLANNRSLSVALEREAARSRRTGRPFSVLVLDIDNFKVFNDMLGHQAGDTVLLDLARILNEARRETDLPGRMGGDEFHMILPETDYAGVMEVAERLRALVAQSDTRYPGQDVPMTISIGAATFPTHGETIADVIRVADMAMYAVKRMGGNGVRWGTDEDVEAGPGRVVSFGLLEMLTNYAAAARAFEPHVPPESVAKVAMELAEDMGLSEDDRRALRIASETHRIGLFREQFDPARWAAMDAAARRESVQALEIGKLFMDATPLVRSLLDVSYFHHLDIDDGVEPPPLARVLALVEEFVALTVCDGVAARDAVDRLSAEAGRYHAEALAALARRYGAHPETEQAA